MLKPDTIRVDDYADYGEAAVNADMREYAKSSTRLITEPYDEESARKIAEEGDATP